MFTIDNITVNAHSSIRIACPVEGGAREVIVRVDPFLIDADHGVAEAPHDADVVLFTHSHYDHFSPEDAAKVAKPGTIYGMPVSMVDDAVMAGISMDDIVGLAPESVTEIAGVVLLGVPAYNVTAKFHPEANEWLGYVIALEDGQTVYVVGDSDAAEVVREMECEYVLIPVGGTYTFDAAGAAAVVNTMAEAGCLKAVVPTHYGSAVGTAADGPAFVAALEPAVAPLAVLKF